MHAAYYSLLVPHYKISTWMINHLRVVHNKMDRFLYIMSLAKKMLPYNHLNISIFKFQLKILLKKFM